MHLIDFLKENEIPFTQKDDGSLHVHEHLYLYGTFTRLPENLSRLEVDGDLYVSSDTERLPDFLRVKGDLDLCGNTIITRLPDNLSIGGSLDISGCTNITQLPENLSIGRVFSWGGSGIQCRSEFPDSMEIGGCRAVLRSYKMEKQLLDALSVDSGKSNLTPSP